MNISKKKFCENCATFTDRNDLFCLSDGFGTLTIRAERLQISNAPQTEQNGSISSAGLNTAIS